MLRSETKSKITIPVFWPPKHSTFPSSDNITENYNCKLEYRIEPAGLINAYLLGLNHKDKSQG